MTSDPGRLATSHTTMIQEANMLGRVEASIMGESALIDRETGRVFWEGGSSTTLVESIVAANLDRFGAEHAQAALLTAFITVAFLGVLGGWLRQIMVVPPARGDASSVLLRIIHFIISNTLFRMPRLENRWLVIFTIALYLLESYNCATRRFLANSIVSPTEVEEYIERLRSEEPVVKWLVRSFHYRKRRIFALSEIVQALVRKLKPAREGVAPSVPTPKKCSPAFPFTRKVVTHEATTNYQYQSCTDNTIAGVWRRSDATSLGLAPFTKIIMTKLLVLSDRKTREDYFRQQSDFVTEHGRGDEFTQFATDIQVPGFRPRILAVRSIQGISSAKLFRLHLFWLFTFCGLTVPYRIWFKRHCDALRVSVVKETSATPRSTSYWDRASQWMPARANLQPYTRNNRESAFHSYMRGRSLYDESALSRQDQTNNSSGGTAGQ